jgi:RNA polymerase sigma-70 factor, ECF subfamily
MGSKHIERGQGETPGAVPDADADLMLRFQSGDEGAFAALVRRYQDRIVSLAYRYLASSADAEDLAQEVFLRVYRAKDSYRASAKFSTWIHRITANASLNQLRGAKARRSLSAPLGRDEGGIEFEDEAAETPEAGLEKDELTRVLRRIVAELPERQRIAILLNKYEGLGYEEVAQAMEMSVTAVKSLLTRARVNIRERLEPYLESGRFGGLAPQDLGAEPPGAGVEHGS